MIDLKKAADIEMNQTREILLNFPWEHVESYALWLAQTYHMVSYSTRLVALAGGCVPLESNELHHRFIDHSKEERNHQLLCVSDLKALGRSLEQYPCLPVSVSLAQIQYYWIQHRAPTSLFGYILSLECMATNFGSQLYRKVSEAHGKKAGSFLKVHSEDDIEHTQKAFEILSRLSEPEQVSIEENLKISAGLYRTMLAEIRYNVILRQQKAA